MRTEVWYVTSDELDEETPVALAEQDGRIVVMISASATGAAITPALASAFAAWQEQTDTGMRQSLRVLAAS